MPCNNDFAEESSEELVRRMKREKDKSVYDAMGEVLFLRHNGPLFATAYSLCHHNPDLAEELVSATWEGFFTTIGTYDPGRSKVKTRLNRIMLNKFASMLRHEGCRTRALAAIRLRSDGWTSGCGCECVRRLLAEHCRPWVDELPQVLREALNAYVANDMSIKQTAEVLHVTWRTAEWRVKQAMERLREHAPELHGLLRLMHAWE